MKFSRRVYHENTLQKVSGNHVGKAAGSRTFWFQLAIFDHLQQSFKNVLAVETLSDCYQFCVSDSRLTCL